MENIYTGTFIQWNPLSNKLEQATNTCNSIDECQMHYASWKKPDPKGYILCNSMDMTSWKKQNYRDRNETSVYQGLGLGSRQLQRGTRELSGLMGMFCMVTVMELPVRCDMPWWLHALVRLQKKEFFCIYRIFRTIRCT